ncbi:MAG: J domain-containing protein [Alphaproteobacteria bacterium]
MTRRREIPLADPGLRLRQASAQRRCQAPGCAAEAEHRAPRSRTNLNEYVWFCLEHVRAYNQRWNYFQGMTDDDIAKYQRDAVTGHRPTWRMSDRAKAEALAGGVGDVFGLFGGEAAAPEPPQARHIPKHVRKAMDELGLEGRPDLQQIKMRYKQLVKRYHPDANGGDRSVEERFKAITAAYRTLVSSGSF